MSRIFYLCNGKAPCRDNLLTECCFANPDGCCRHTTIEEYAQNGPVENPENDFRFREERVYGNNNVIWRDFWEVE